MNGLNGGPMTIDGGVVVVDESPDLRLGRAFRGQQKTLLIFKSIYRLAFEEQQKIKLRANKDE